MEPPLSRERAALAAGMRPPRVARDFDMGSPWAPLVPRGRNRNGRHARAFRGVIARAVRLTRSEPQARHTHEMGHTRGSRL